MSDKTRYATQEEDKLNPSFMVEENQVEPPEVGKPGVMYGFRNPENDEVVYIYWRNWQSRRKLLDPMHEIMDALMAEHGEQVEIDLLNDLYNAS